MAKLPRNFRVEEVECGDDRGLFKLYELRDVPEAEKPFRLEEEHQRWELIDTFATRTDAEAAAKPSR
jgi:hypothetical protein